MFALLLLAFFGFPPLPQAQTNVIDSADYPTRIPGQCGSDLSQFDCGNGSCIPVTLVRDCVINCPDGSDEECGEGQLLCDNNMPSPGGNGCGICVENTPTGVTACMDRRWAAVCEQENVFKCECTMNCVYPGWLLDGADDCGDGSDENPCIANRTNGCPTDAECVFNAKSLNHTCECRSGYIPFASLCIPSIGVTMATPSSPMPPTENCPILQLSTVAFPTTTIITATATTTTSFITSATSMPTLAPTTIVTSPILTTTTIPTTTTTTTTATAMSTAILSSSSAVISTMTQPISSTISAQTITTLKATQLSTAAPQITTSNKPITIVTATTSSPSSLSSSSSSTTTTTPATTFSTTTTATTAASTISVTAPSDHNCSESYQCANGNCINDLLVLDGIDNCGDSSDEDVCKTRLTTCAAPPSPSQCSYSPVSHSFACGCPPLMEPNSNSLCTPLGDLPFDCSDALKKNVDEPSGLTMTFDTCNLPMQCARHLLCDQDTDGGGWTTIQHKNSTGSFARTWLEYKDGFGNATNDDFWLGNELIHRLTSVRDYELLVVMKIPLSSNGHMIVKYGSFAIGDETDGYKLTVGAVSMIIGTNANDLLKSNGAQFSARDQGPSNLCARVYQSGWWFDAICSGGGNLNVPIGGEPSNPNLVGITWGGQEVSAVAMLIREKGFPIPPQKQESVLGALGVSVVHSARIVLLGLFVVVALAY